MKSLKITAVLTALVASIPLAVGAQGVTKSASIDLIVDNPGTAQSATNQSWSRSLELGQTAGWYIIDYSGGVSLSSDAGSAQLTGLCGSDPASKTYAPNTQGAIWSFNYSSDGINWTSAGTVLESASVPANTLTQTFSDSGTNSGVWARYIQIEYFASLNSTYDASAGGSATMTATAVPEPSSLAFMLTAAAPLGYMFRRKLSG